MTIRRYNVTIPGTINNEIELRIKPKSGETIEITSDSQVDENTKFKD